MNIRPRQPGYLLRDVIVSSLLIAFSSLGSVVVLAQEEMVASKRECATCHIADISDFNQDLVKTLIPYDPEPVTSTGRQKVEGSERMCFSCHDGFMQDARYLWTRIQNTHPVGVKPSDKVSIPVVNGKQTMPLNMDGLMYCGTCHFAHGVDWEHHDEMEDSPVFLRKRNIESSLCVSCHEERSTGPANGNHPIHRSLEKLPPELVEAGAKFGKRRTLICQSCHTPHGAPDKRLLLVENPDSRLCGSCHKKRYADNKAEAARFGTHPVNVTSSDIEVSEELLAAGGKLSSTGKIICQSCHKQHLAVSGTNLLVQDNQDAALCKNCHKKEFAIADSRHDMRLVNTDLANARDQSVGSRGVCSSCHLPHGGMGPKMWARDIETQEDPMSHTCLGCHKEQGVAEEHLVGEHSHPVGVELSSGNDSRTLPLYSIEGVKLGPGKDGFVSCASCHDPHQWNPNDPSMKSLPAGDNDPAHLFLREAAVTPSTLCESCHQDKQATSETQHNLARSAPEEQNINGEAAKNTDTCRACHLVHKGNGPAMWARNQVDGAGMSWLCIDCHGDEGIAKNRMTGINNHPIRIDADSPGSSLPLFNAEGERDNDGQIDCATCHDPHSGVPGKINMPTNSLQLAGDNSTNKFLREPSAKEDVTLCVECHEDKRWLAGTEHDLRVSAPENLNRTGQNVYQSGICGQCHASHDAVVPDSLWALDPGPGTNRVDTFCQSCHMEGKSAQTKVPVYNSHPELILSTIEAMRTARNESESQQHARLPLSKEKRPESTFGTITCATCHDPHQWSPARQELGPASPTEGNILNSFLKMSDSRSFYCAGCHGLDSLFRYMNFHATDSYR